MGYSSSTQLPKRKADDADDRGINAAGSRLVRRWRIVVSIARMSFPTMEPTFDVRYNATFNRIPTQPKLPMNAPRRRIFDMRTGRPKSGLEDLSDRPGFLATTDQREWLEAARLAAGEASLSEYLRRLAAEDGEKLLGTPFPRRKPLPKPKGKR
jgi:hypothetical protein